MMCLLCSKIDLVSIIVNHDSLTANYFKTKVSIKEFKEPDKSPLEQLEMIFIDEDVKAPMLTTLVTIRAFIPRITVSKIKHGDLEGFFLKHHGPTVRTYLSPRECWPIKV
jgi:hypothetical protein